MVYPVIFCSFAALLLIYNIECQICTKREVFTTQVLEYRTYTYLEARKSCDWYSRYDADCGKPRIKTDSRPVVLTKRIIQNIQYCCDGYVRTDSGIDNERIDCAPSCIPSCVNSACDHPGQCNCYDGYMKDPTNQHRCIPICIEGCKHGNCKQPNVCECNIGYQNTNGYCSPVCTEICHNGTCVAPDICDCLPGYRRSEINTCEPYCYSGCEHGSCVAPETCTCDHGWFLTNDSKCETLCDPQLCISKKCNGQNKCECLPGYESDEGGVCKPICKSCQGSCIGPYNCQCDLPLVAIDYAVDDTPCDCFLNCTDYDVKCEKTICLEITTSLPTIIDDEVTDTTAYDEFTVNEEILDVNISIKQSQSHSSRLDFDWTVITMIFCSLILLVTLTYLVISRWKYLVIYFKGSSYIVEDARDVYQSSQFVNVPLSDQRAGDVSTRSFSKD